MARGVRHEQQPTMFSEPGKPGPASIEQIKRVAAHFDAKGKPEQHIDVNLSRGWLIQHFKLSRRGGRIMFGQHELRAYGEAVVERAPAPRKKRQAKK